MSPTSDHSVVAIVPCHNEEITIGKVVRDLSAAVPEMTVYVYDNNSTDRTVEEAKAATGKGNFGYAFRATMPERSGFWQDMTNYVYGFGGNWADGKQLTLNSPKVVEAITAGGREAVNM